MKAPLGGRAKALSLSRRSLTTTAAITQPAEENFEERFAPSGVERVTENGQQQASDIWASVNSAAAAAAKGTWEGVKPVKKVLFSDVLYSPKREAFLRKWVPTDITYASFIGAMHLGCLLAPFTFTWSAFNCFLVMYFITGCLGITLSYHRQLSHKELQHAQVAGVPPRVLRRDGGAGRPPGVGVEPPAPPPALRHAQGPAHAVRGVLVVALRVAAGQRSHVEARRRPLEREIAAQPFYRWLEKTYIWHVVAWAAAFYALGGLPWLVWGFCVRTCWVYHITWAVNSVAHVWGSQTYNTGDLSRNNWWIGILAFGEGWHSNHHAFEFSAKARAGVVADRHDLDVRLRAEILRAGGQGEAPQAGAAGQDADQARGRVGGGDFSREEARAPATFFEVPGASREGGAERLRETKQNRRVVL